MLETIQELDERMNGLIESLGTVDFENEDLARQFIEAKFMTLSLHAHTEQEKLKQIIKDSSDKMKFTKQWNLYQSIENILSKKCSNLSLTEMVEKLNKCKELVSSNV